MDVTTRVRVGTNLGRRANRCTPARLLVATMSFLPACPAQNASTSSISVQESDDSEARPASDPVLSVRGICQEPQESARSTGDCTVTVSRQDFDALMSILSPSGHITPEMKRHVAESYAEMLALANAARDLKLDDSPRYRATVRWLESKMLADMLRRHLEQESRSVPEAEIEAYYREEPSRFEEVRIRRLVLPKSELARQMAVTLRDRAARGEDMEHLQKEAYQALSESASPPTTDVGTRRKANLPSGVSDEIFFLQPGEVSQVENETYSLVIYKVEAKSRVPLERARNEIITEIAQKKVQQAIQTLTEQVRVERNQEYFGPASPNSGDFIPFKTK